MNIFSKDEIDQLQTIVEQLDICCNFMKDDSVTKSRIVIILLDNISETILNRVCNKIFEWDNYTKWIMPQKYSSTKQVKAKRVFPEKINTAKKQGEISKELLESLNICHKYRNAIYHRDEHNPNIIPIIAKILFLIVCDLVKDTQCGFGLITIGGMGDHVEWLKQYGINNSVVNFENVTKTISEKLKSQVVVDQYVAASTFSSDLNIRINSIKALIDKKLPWKTETQINHLLKWLEFQEAYPHSEDELSQEYRSMNYRIAQGKTDDINPSKYKTIKEEFQKKYHAKVEAYQQKITCAILKDAEEVKKNLVNSSSLTTALHDYFIIDDPLSKFEKYLELIYLEFDRAVQKEIDISRGK